MRISLATQFTTQFLAVIILTAGTVGYLVEREAEELLIAKEQTRIGVRLRVKAVRLARSLKYLQSDLEMISILPAILGLVRAEEDDGALARNGTLRDRLENKLRNVFKHVRIANSNYLSASYHDFFAGSLEPLGDGSSPTSNGFEALAVQAEDYPAVRPVEGVKAKYSEVVEASESGGHPSIRGSMPVYGSDGRIAGAVVLDLDLGSLFAGEFRPDSEGTRLLIADESGRIAGGSSLDGTKITLPEMFASTRGLFGGKSTVSERLLHVATDQGDFSVQTNKIVWTDSPGRFFVLVCVTPYSTVLSVAKGLGPRSLRISGILIALGAVLTFFLARFLTRPLSEITRAAREFGRGGSDVHLPTKAKGEVAVLSDAVATMIAQVQERDAKVRSSEERLRSILGHAADGVITIEGRGSIMSFNKKAEELFGHEESEVLGKNVSMLMPDDLARVHDHYLERYHQRFELCDLESGSYIRELREVQGKRKDGTLFPLEITISEVSISGQVCFTGIVRDVSARKQAERERDQLLREMEAKNTELERFTYTVSHDLKSPLITIQGFAELLAKDLESGDRSRLGTDLGRIQDAASHMFALLDKLLELSRIGRHVAPSEDVVLGGVIATIRETLHKRVEDRGVEILVGLGLPTVRGDKQSLIEVFQNLIENAVKFMGDQELPEIEIGSRSESGEDVLFVRDNGVGIPDAYRDRVFGLFERLDPEIEGTGVGLALVKRVVELHGGRIWVESGTGGRGTCICLTLPSQPAELSPA